VVIRAFTIFAAADAFLAAGVAEFYFCFGLSAPRVVGLRGDSRRPELYRRTARLCPFLYSPKKKAVSALKKRRFHVFYFILSFIYSFI
jgi:hypothetical protein